MSSPASVPARSTSYLWSISACLLFLGLVLCSQPYAATGMVDDWSTFRTAEVLAHTGHMQYNGWEAPILGWPMYVAAAAMRLAGFSYTVARFTVVLESALLLFVLHRAFVRCGIAPAPAAFATLCLAVTPPYFANSVLLMTDIPGLLGVVFCWYLCLRALQASTDRLATLWILSACCAGALLGTTRQIAWLGLLVMVPCALWLLHSRGRTWTWGASAWCAGALYVLLMMRWLDHQPYVLPEQLLQRRLFVHQALGPLVRLCIRAPLELLLLLAPMALSLYSGLRKGRSLMRNLLWCAVAFAVASVAIAGYTRRQAVLAPYLLPDSQVATISLLFLSFGTPLQGPPHLLSWLVRVVLTGVTLAAFAAVWSAFAARKSEVPSSTYMDDASLAVLTLPFCVLYFVVLLPRAITLFTVDRYMLFLLPFVLLWLLRLSLRLPQYRISASAVLCLFAFAACSTAAMHDIFASFRADLLAMDRAFQLGIAREQISGGIEYDFSTQLLHANYINVPGTRLADGQIAPGIPFAPASPCTTMSVELTPAVHAAYLTATSDSPCRRVTGIEPVPLRTWLPPYGQSVIVAHWNAGQ